MINYIFKRLLVMVPTFVVITLIIFVVLNLAPGDPSADQAAEGTEAVSQDAQEAYRIFQEQFNLDKPILFNTRFRLDREDVEPKVLTLADYDRPVCPEDGEQPDEADDEPAGADADQVDDAGDEPDERADADDKADQETADADDEPPAEAEDDDRDARGEKRADADDRETDDEELADGDADDPDTDGEELADGDEQTADDETEGDDEADDEDEVAAGPPAPPQEPPSDPVEYDCIDAEDRPGSADVIDAQETLSDWGDSVVLELFEIARDHERLDVRFVAFNQLPSNARQAIIDRADRTPPDIVRAMNRVINRENNQIRDWRIPRSEVLGMDQQEVHDRLDQALDEHWEPWIDQNRQRFELSTGEKATRFFLDTRFARYWENLLPLTGVTTFQFVTLTEEDLEGIEGVEMPEDSTFRGRPFDAGFDQIDLGLSTVDERPVSEAIVEKLPYTITIAFLAMLLAYLISVPIGIWSAYNQNTLKDQVMTVVLFMLYSLPNFFAAILLIEFFSVGRPFEWFPVGGFMADAAQGAPVMAQLKSIAWHIFLPVICLTYPSLAMLSRYARTGILDVIRADYIRTARAKGLSETMVILKHAVRNGMIPILTLLGTALPFLVSGSLVIEFIFDIPGIGLYLYESIFMYDYNAIMGCLLMSTILTLIGILLSDISYALVDPRITFD